LESLKIPRGKWEYSELYRDALIAKDWGLSPTEFWGLSSIDKAIMTSTSMASAEMQLYEDYISSKERNASNG